MRRGLPFSTKAFAGAGTLMLVLPHVAMAASGLPQMDFSNPLTFIQLIWMAVIMIVLYLLLSRWALPRIGGVIEARNARIAGDLDVAQRAKDEAQAAVAALNKAIRQARESSQSTIAKAVDAAKAHAGEQAHALNQRLDQQLAAAEAQIAEARASAMASLPPIAIDLTATLVQRLTGAAPDTAAISRALSLIQGSSINMPEARMPEARPGIAS
jgi:F-type H+-transporting ATPase subunit b